MKGRSAAEELAADRPALVRLGMVDAVVSEHGATSSTSRCSPSTCASSRSPTRTAGPSGAGGRGPVRGAAAGRGWQGGQGLVTAGAVGATSGRWRSPGEPCRAGRPSQSRRPWRRPARGAAATRSAGVVDVAAPLTPDRDRRSDADRASLVRRRPASRPSGATCRRSTGLRPVGSRPTPCSDVRRISTTQWLLCVAAAVDGSHAGHARPQGVSRETWPWPGVTSSRPEPR